MKPLVFLETDRLLLRHWQPTDYEPYIQMNRDPNVRKYFPGLLSREETRAHISTIQKNIDQWGYGLFAVEWKETGAFIGFIGLSHPGFENPLQQHSLPSSGPGAGSVPWIEIGWRLSPHYWGKGLATEGAKACLRAGFTRWGLREIFSFTSIHNRPSEQVMIRIGMIRQGSFFHPLMPAGHRLNEHVLYKAASTNLPGQS